MLGEGVDSYDNAIGCVIEIVSEFIDVVDCLDDLVGVGRGGSVFGGGEPEGFDFGAELREGGGEGGIGYFANAMGCESQVAGGGHFWIELFDGTRAGVSWVHEKVVAGFFAFIVDSDELGEGDVHFASNFEDLGDGIWIEIEGKGFDGSDGMGDVVAVLAIASCEGADEDTFFVADGEGDAVDFGFADEGGF